VSDSRLITIREAAYRLSLAEITVRRMVQRNELPVVRIGKRSVRIPLEDVERISVSHSRANAPASRAFRTKKTRTRTAS
jgi:excisionase family DNA binding protein